MVAASTANNSDQILIAATGTVYVGAYASVTAPTSEVSTLDTDLIQLGYVTEDGVTLRDDKTVKDYAAWQTPYSVRRTITGRMFEVSFSLEQFNWATLPFALGGGTLTEPTSGHYKYVPPAAGDLDERAMVIDWNDGSSRTYRLFMPRGIVQAAVEVNVRRTDQAVLPITFGANFDGTNPAYTLFSNDAAFEVS